MIKEEINNKGYKIDQVIQHSYNPLVNDAIQFFMYSGNEISHIVSSYRNPVQSRQRLYEQNEIMDCILRKVRGTPIRENILFSTWIVDLPGGCFRIQEFKKKGFRFQVSRFNSSDLQKYLDISCDWIIEFQSVTGHNGKLEHPVNIKQHIYSDIVKMRRIYLGEPDIMELLFLLENKIEVLKTPMPLAMHHGDYCHWNCFTDTANIFSVIDWEFAKISEWVVIDFISNLLVIWVALRKNKTMNEALRSFFDPRNDEEVMLSQKILNLNSLYGFDINEIKFYVVYVFIRLFLREERPASRIHWEPFLSDMISILKSLP